MLSLERLKLGHHRLQSLLVIVRLGFRFSGVGLPELGLFPRLLGGFLSAERSGRFCLDRGLELGTRGFNLGLALGARGFLSVSSSPFSYASFTPR